MSVLAGLDAKLEHVQEQLRHAFADAPNPDDVCLTCSFQAEDVLLLKLALELRPQLPTLFLDTGYHFAETYAYRDRIAREWNVKLINLLPLQYSRGAGGRARAALSDKPGSLLRGAQSGAAVSRRCELQGVDHRVAAGAGKDARDARRVRAVYAARRAAGVEAEPAGAFHNSGCVACVRAVGDSATATVCARIFIDRLRTLHVAAARFGRCAIGPLGRTQGGVRHSHRSSKVSGTKVRDTGEAWNT